MASKTYHVIPTSKGWLLRKAGTTDKRVFTTQREAVASARRHFNSTGQIVVHDAQGKIRRAVSYGLPKIQPPRAGNHAKAMRIEKAITSMILGDVLSPAN